MEREPPPVTVSVPGPGGDPPDLLISGPSPSHRSRLAPVLALLAVAVLGAAAVRGGTTPAPAPDPAPSRPPVQTVTSGITATASLGGAPTDQPGVQRLTLTVGLPAFDGLSDSGGRLLGDEMQLVGVRVRGFAVQADGAGVPVPLGRFGRSRDGRSTTVPVEAVVVDCAVEALARRDVDLIVRTGEGPEGLVRAVADADVVRALDRLVSRTCRRPRG